MLGSGGSVPDPVTRTTITRSTASRRGETRPRQHRWAAPTTASRRLAALPLGCGSRPSMPLDLQWSQSRILRVASAGRAGHAFGHDGGPGSSGNRPSNAARRCRREAPTYAVAGIQQAVFVLAVVTGFRYLRNLDRRRRRFRSASAECLGPGLGLLANRRRITCSPHLRREPRPRRPRRRACSPPV